MITTLAVATILVAAAPSARAQKILVNCDESKVGSYILPDPLALENGDLVRDAATWQNRRRPEILHLFENNIYARSPGRPKNLTFESSIPVHPLWAAKP
jgi:hypothetical protein